MPSFSLSGTPPNSRLLGGFIGVFCGAEEGVGFSKQHGGLFGAEGRRFLGLWGRARYEFLNNKVKEPSRSIELLSVKEQADLVAELIDQANTEIKKHNDIVANFVTEKAI